MLFKIEKHILKKVSKQPYKNQIDLTSFRKYSGEDVYSAFKSLKEKGYFELVSAGSDYSSFSYVLSVKGKFYKEYKFKELLKNIVIPFIVALLTTIATLYLEELVENDNSANTSGYTCEYCNND